MVAASASTSSAARGSRPCPARLIPKRAPRMSTTRKSAYASPTPVGPRSAETQPLDLCRRGHARPGCLGSVHRVSVFPPRPARHGDGAPSRRGHDFNPGRAPFSSIERGENPCRERRRTPAVDEVQHVVEIDVAVLRSSATADRNRRAGSTSIRQSTTSRGTWRGVRGVVLTLVGANPGRGLTCSADVRSEGPMTQRADVMHTSTPTAARTAPARVRRPPRPHREARSWVAALRGPGTGARGSPVGTS